MNEFNVVQNYIAYHRQHKPLLDINIQKRCLDRVRVRSDKDRTGTTTIVPVRTGTVILEKYRKF